MNLQQLRGLVEATTDIEWPNPRVEEGAPVLDGLIPFTVARKARIRVRSRRQPHSGV